MTERTNDHSKPQFMDSETALGGADAVEKTSYVVGKGTDPNALSPHGQPAEVGRQGVNPVVWGIALVVVLLIVVYAFSMFRG
ncbi:MAG: hypothetical protein M3Z30_02215 [Gemmatimonadota bacterium]|nr:hypothetical protein [Gemmatimonadota bacterium]